MTALTIGTDQGKYLAQLEKFLEPLSTGTPRELVACLPGVFSIVKMMYTISRHYSSEERLTTFLCKLTNQLGLRCVAS